MLKLVIYTYKVKDKDKVEYGIQIQGEAPYEDSASRNLEAEKLSWSQQYQSCFFYPFWFVAVRSRVKYISYIYYTTKP